MFLLKDAFVYLVAYGVVAGVGFGLFHLSPLFPLFQNIFKNQQEMEIVFLSGCLSGLVTLIVMVNVYPPTIPEETASEEDTEDEEETEEEETDEDTENDEDSATTASSDEEAEPRKRRKCTEWDAVFKSGILESETAEAWKPFRPSAEEETTSDSDYVPPPRIGQKRGRSPEKRSMRLRSDD